ncbi:MAG: triose-phosphate isomerase [Candidatus Rokubacteria bacterium]|nr:triose-phosphate isomerase [Candidatus Rokubacteria bacterium]
MRTPLVVANWKMHGTCAEARTLALGVREGLQGVEGVEVVLCPPFTALAAVGGVLAGSRLGLGAQDAHWEAAGAFTGAVSPAMLVELGCRVVILGHSERRQHFGERDEMINQKVRAALAHGLTPILCVGEREEERERGATFAVVETQLRGGLAGLGAAEVARVVLAYEPVWAIGTGRNATPEQAVEVHAFLRGLLGEAASKEVAQAARILYGGSVKPDNVGPLIAEPEIDGGLVGGASLRAPEFAAIVRTVGAAGGGRP